MRFVKMHGCENDYVVVDALADPSCAAIARRPEIARAICNRRSGVGADGLLLLTPSDSSGADARMSIINADGSDGGMCGNGARCAVKLLVESGHVSPTPNGLVRLAIGERIVEAHAARDESGEVRSVRLDLGAISFEPESLPFESSRASPQDGGWMIEGRVWHIASIGNPHAVAFVEEPIDSMDLARLGPSIEHHEAFPERSNVHVVNVESPTSMSIRSWERGCGETRACGSGACAVVAIGIGRGVLNAEQAIRVRVLGGELLVRRKTHSGSMLLEGPAARVYEGTWPCADPG